MQVNHHCRHHRLEREICRWRQNVLTQHHYRHHARWRPRAHALNHSDKQHFKHKEHESFNYTGLDSGFSINSIKANLFVARSVPAKSRLRLIVVVLRNEPAEVDTICEVKIRRNFSLAAEGLVQPLACIFLGLFGFLNYRCHAKKFVRHARIHLALDRHAGFFQSIFQHRAIA